MVKRKAAKAEDFRESEPAPVPTDEADVPEGMELWDYYCPVRSPVHDQKYAYLDKETISESFECPICLDVVKGTMVVTECMHRFCQECIEKTMRLGKKQCPTCRSQVPSRRALRSDKTFDEIAETLFLKGECTDDNNNDSGTSAGAVSQTSKTINESANGEDCSNDDGNEDKTDEDYDQQPTRKRRNIRQSSASSSLADAMDYRRYKTTKWDTLEEREQETLDEETRKIVEKYRTSDFAKLVARGMQKQRAILEEQLKSEKSLGINNVAPDALAEDGDEHPTRGREGHDSDADYYAPNIRRKRNKRGSATKSTTTSPPQGKRISRRKKVANTENTVNGCDQVYKNISPGVNVVLDPLSVDPAKDPLLAQLPPLERRYVMISGNAPISAVAKFLAGKIGAPETHVALAMECGFQVPAHPKVLPLQSAQGFKVLSPSVTLHELNALKKCSDLMASPTLYLKYFSCHSKEVKGETGTNEIKKGVS